MSNQQQVLIPEYKDTKCPYCEGRGFNIREVYDQGKLNPRSEVYECVFCGGSGNAFKPIL